MKFIQPKQTSQFKGENHVHCVKTTKIIKDTIKKSRFIGILMPCLSENEALQYLNQLHQQYPDASHIVFAYRIKSPKGTVMKFHDAGEPSGTAGKPIYQHLEGKNIINVLCIVIRYFGGIKLGAGGLTRAYGNCARQVIEASQMTEYIEYAFVQFVLEYRQLQMFEYQLKKLDGVFVEQDFSENISLLIKIPENNLAILTQTFNPVNRN